MTSEESTLLFIGKSIFRIFSSNGAQHQRKGGGAKYRVPEAQIHAYKRCLRNFLENIRF